MISIVMPCYNCETSLARTVRCVQAQTVSDWELIAVDDGSTDGTGAALDGLAQNDARIRAIHQANGGVSRARNIGMAAAGGEWLAFVDADDVLPPDAAAKRCLHWTTARRISSAAHIPFGIRTRADAKKCWPAPTATGRRCWRALSAPTARSIPCEPNFIALQRFGKKGSACRPA